MNTNVTATDNFIPGIYNYCDRWCERCAFTTRCQCFEPNDKRVEIDEHPGNDDWLKEVESNLQNAITMLTEMAAEQGIAIKKKALEEFPNAMAFLRPGFD